MKNTPDMKNLIETLELIKRRNKNFDFKELEKCFELSYLGKPFLVTFPKRAVDWVHTNLRTTVLAGVLHTGLLDLLLVWANLSDCKIWFLHHELPYQIRRSYGRFYLCNRDEVITTIDSLEDFDSTLKKYAL